MVGKPFTEELRALVVANGMSDRVHELIGISNEDLMALYSTAELLLFPSLEEGFGWPIVEANLCGCPVVTSNRAPMNEIGGSAALYVDPLDCEGAARAIAHAFPRIPTMRQESLENASRFSTRDMLDSYVELYTRTRSELRSGNDGLAA
jgi:glycosyltransferase involved in cell wall biosynthesis